MFRILKLNTLFKLMKNLLEQLKYSLLINVKILNYMESVRIPRINSKEKLTIIRYILNFFKLIIHRYY